MLMSVCADPDVLKLMYFVNIGLTLIKITLPLILIVKASLDTFKTVTSGDAKDFKEAMLRLGRRILAGILIFFAPTMVNIVIGFASENVDILACFTDATYDNVQLAYARQADIALNLAESTLAKVDYNDAYYYVSNLDSGTTKANYEARLNILKDTMNDINSKKQANIKARARANASSTGKGSAASGDPLSVSGSYYSNGLIVANPGVALQSEPDPSAAINYWASKNVISAGNFVYPKDPNTGLSLGAWPSNYSSIPTQLTSYKTYLNGALIFPTTPVDGIYHTVYEHNGIDIMARFGTPVYSPVDGYIDYSEWGHTGNKGSDETAYSVGIKLNTPFQANGVTIDRVFLTHMSGIVYRCSRCNLEVKKGQLLGFTGNASGTATSVGWAPHLHMTLYNSLSYSDTGQRTSKVESLYGIPNGTKDYAIVAGG